MEREVVPELGTISFKSLVPMEKLSERKVSKAGQVSGRSPLLSSVVIVASDQRSVVSPT